MKNFASLVLLLFCLIGVALGQSLDLDRLKGLRIRNIGPAGMSGRVTSIDVVQSQTEQIFIGTASGGVWKSENGGISWKPIFDKQPTQSIGAVAINQSNPSEVWVGTGEGNPRNSHNSGQGIFKSIDGGRSWQFKGLAGTKNIHRIVVNAHNPEIILVGATGSAWGESEERGVFRSADGGETWKKVLYTNELTGCADLIVDPTNPNKLFAAMWEHKRQPWFFTSGGEGSGLYMSIDGGITWKKRTHKHGLPKGELGRMGLAMSADNPTWVYALIESKKTALYKSEDGGYTFKKVSDKNIGNRPFYYADIYADPSNASILYNLWSQLSKSTDGGRSFRSLSGWTGIHPDHHALWINPGNGNHLIEGNDGGLNISYDGGKTWRFVRNLPLAQFYHINHDMDIPYNVYGGLQDNGSWKGPSEAWRFGGLKSSLWQELVFGDGFDVAPDPEDSRFGYAMYQGGGVYYYDALTGNNQFVQPQHPDGKTLRFNWNAGLALDPHNKDALYFGSQYVHYSNDHGKSWKIISPDLTTNDTSRQKQAQSGGLTIDATKAENFTTITAIAPSPLHQKTIWVGTDDGNIQLTQNGGESWQELSGRLKGLPEHAWITQINASKYAQGEAWVVANNYRQNDWLPYVYYTSNYGKSWSRLASEDQVDGHCWAVVQDPVEPRLLFLGTDKGLYFSLNKGEDWQKWDKGFPSCPVRDLKIHPREYDLIIGTFGRAVWIMDDVTPLRVLAAKGTSILEQDFFLFPGGKGVQHKWAATTGERFAANAAFRGENARYGVPISIWVSRKEGDKEEKKKKDEDEPKEKAYKGVPNGKVRIQIIDDGGDTIRSYHSKIDTGFLRLYWPFNKNGIRMPSYSSPKKDADLPGSRQVLPGKYTVKVSYRDQSQETTVEVLQDPRIESDNEEALRKERLHERLDELVEQASLAFDALKDAQKTIARVDKLSATSEDSVIKALPKDGKKLGKQIKAYMEEFMLPKDFEGYDHVSIKLNNKLGSARSLIEVGGGNAMIALDNAETATNELVKKINEFMLGDWTAYQKKVESVSFKLFKEFEPIGSDKD